jgi:hypothetical protein
MERMSEGLENEVRVLKTSSYDQYVGALSSRMMLPKNWQENTGANIPLSPMDVAPYVTDKKDERIELGMRSLKSGKYISTNSELPFPANGNELKNASKSEQLAALAEAEARLRAASRSDNLPDYIRYSGNIDGKIKRLRSEAEKILNDDSAQKRIKTASGLAALAMAASACASVVAPTAQSTLGPEVATNVAQVVEAQKTQAAEPTRFPDGKFYPIKEAFEKIDNQTITTVTELSANDPLWLDIQNAAREQEITITDITAFLLIDENGEERPFAFISQGKYNQVVYKIDSKGYYHSLSDEGDFVFLPIIHTESSGQIIYGFSVEEGILLPGIFSYNIEENNLIFRDPQTGSTVSVPIETNVGQKVNAKLLLKSNQVSFLTQKETPEPLSLKMQAIKDFKELGMDLNFYSLIENQNGIEIYAKNNNTLIYENGKFSYPYVMYAAKQKCEITDIAFKQGTNVSLSEDKNRLNDYIGNIIKTYKFDKFGDHGMFMAYPIKDTKTCWVGADEYYFFFRDRDGTVHQVAVKDIKKLRGKQDSSFSEK